MIRQTRRIVLLLLAIMVQRGALSFQVSPRLSRSRIIQQPLTRTKATASARNLPPLNYRDTEHDSDELVTRKPDTRNAAFQKSSTAKKTVAPSSGQGSHHLVTVRSLATSQAIILTLTTLITMAALFFNGHGFNINSVHWNGSNDFFSLWDLRLTPTRLVEGVAAAMPMIYFGSMLEHSDRRDASHVNFSTINMVMTLFGRRQHTHPITEEANGHHPDLHPETSMFQVMVLSLCLAVLTGMTEEILFRGVIPSLIVFQTQAVMAGLFGQAFLFGIGHLSPQATSEENKIVSGFQVANGIWHGVVYLAAGGDVLPCIIAHTLYDMHVFVETWKRTNDQMDYTEEAVLRKLTTDDENEIRQIKREAGPSLSAETLAFARRFFYAFDFDHRGSLSLADVQRAISYAFLHDKVQPSERRVRAIFKRMIKRRKDEGTQVGKDIEDRLRLTEFLRVLFLLKAKPQSA